MVARGGRGRATAAASATGSPAAHHHHHLLSAMVQLFFIYKHDNGPDGTITIITTRTAPVRASALSGRR